MKIYVFPLLFGMVTCQLQQTFMDIPRKIHLEIFGSASPGLVNFPNSLDQRIKVISSSRNFLANPLVSFNHQVQHAPFSPTAFQSSDYQNDSQTSPSLPIPERLFAPAIVKYPAATKGQIEAYKKALEQEAKEQRQEMEKMNQTKFASSYRVRDMEAKAVSYVNVRLGGDNNVNYHYTA